MTVAENVRMRADLVCLEVFRPWKPAAAYRTASAPSSCSRRSAWRPRRPRCRRLAYDDAEAVAVAIALGNDPRLLLMDELTAGMAPKERNDLIALVKRLVIERDIWSFHGTLDGHSCSGLADRIIVLARGKLIADGDAAPSATIRR